jgi:RHS repeat-associated protein
MKQNIHKFLLLFVFVFSGFAFTQDQNGALPATGLAVVEADIEGWQLLTLRHTAHQSGELTVEIFNYTTDPNTGHSPAVYFDDWQIEITKPATTEIVQEVHYDPWGLVMQDESYSTADNTNFLFNSKELQTFADLNFYDYHARQYDPQLGRWHNIDPSSEEFHGLSPYNYCLNNPVMYVDPDGKLPILVFVAAAVVGGGLNVWNNKEKIRDIGSALSYFGVGAVAGAVAVVNPKAGFMIAMGGNATVDIATGNLPNFEKWTDVAKYGFSTAMNSLDMVAVGQTVKWGYTAIKTIQGWRSSVRLVATESTEIALTGVIGPTAEITNTALPAITSLVPVKQVVKEVIKNNNLVYHGIDAAGKVRYIGITSRDAAVRFGEHLNSVGTGKELLRYEVIEGAIGLTKKQARIWEQTLINKYGLGKNGGQLLNKINSISPKKWWKYGIK